jgi:hypothetical protein
MQWEQIRCQIQSGMVVMQWNISVNSFPQRPPDGVHVGQSVPLDLPVTAVDDVHVLTSVCLESETIIGTAHDKEE